MRILNILTLTACTIVFSGCSGDVKSKLGMQKSVPDEFSVVEGPELTMPPSFELPNPGSKAAQGPRNKHSTQELNAAEADFLQTLSTEEKRPVVGAKALVDNDYASQKQKSANKGVIRSTVNRLNVNPDAQAIDPNKEKIRLERNQAAGKDINEGEVALKPDSTSTLGKIFGN